MPICLRYLLLIILFSNTLHAQEETYLGMPLEPGDTGRIYQVVEVMPLFPIGDRYEDYDYYDQAAVADQAMIKFVYDELKYPKKDRKERIEGMAVVSFIVERDGRVTSIKTDRSVSPTIDEEALRIVNVIAWELPYWQPGQQDGQTVRVQFNLPVKFKLPGQRWGRH